MMIYVLVFIIVFFPFCFVALAVLAAAAGTMTQVNRYMHKAPGLPSKFDKVTPR